MLVWGRGEGEVAVEGVGGLNIGCARAPRRVWDWAVSRCDSLELNFEGLLSFSGVIFFEYIFRSLL